MVRGLLLDWQQRWESGGAASVLSTRIARASYGVIVQEIYLPAVHFNDVRPDPFEPSKKWAVNQIQRLIKKGDPVNPNVSVVKSFQIRLAATETAKAWDSQIVISHNDPSQLLSSMKQGWYTREVWHVVSPATVCCIGAYKLCEVKSNLEGVQQDQLVKVNKRGTCWSRGVTFYICKFNVRVVVAPADLRFELWFESQKLSGNLSPYLYIGTLKS